MKKTALITGASSGIGREFAKLHASKKGNLVIVARRKEKLLELKEELESKYDIDVYVIEKDLAKEEAPQEIYDELKKNKIEIDYLINNAGFGGRGKFYERKIEQDLAMINLNIIALTKLTRLFLSDFVKKNSGKILNVSSTAAKVPGGPLQAVYYATKAFVSSFSYGISEELYDKNITVTALHPGATKSEFGKTSGMDKTNLFDKSVSPSKVAKDGYEAMLNGKLEITSGLTFSQKILIKLTPMIPKKTMLKQVRIMQEIK
ncbi:MAG: SDR family NAD(P)-dependent oxidoreductase [Peptostreptococcaceae bacterium]|jgi:short-subunit dehydrogenase|nr:SDR family NAD(P)-dependent oxidoreductase [Peptostreptococcaceae bacterium]